MRKWLCVLILSWLPFLAGAAEPVWTEPAASGVQVHLYLFWSKNCPHCLEARPRLLDLAARNAWVRLQDFELSEHRGNVERFVALAKQVGGEARAVPTLIYCGRMEVGLDSSDAGMAKLLGRLQACRALHGTAADSGTASLRLPLLGEIDPARLSLPLLTVLIAGMDAFNPCAFFVLLFLLSLLVHQSDRWRMALIGGVFVAFSGLMYFAFMAAWLNLFLVLGSLPWVTGAAGLLALLMGAVNVKDFVRFRQGLSLSISDSGKATIFQRARRLLTAESLPAMLGSMGLSDLAGDGRVLRVERADAAAASHFEFVFNRTHEPVTVDVEGEAIAASLAHVDDGRATISSTLPSLVTRPCSRATTRSASTMTSSGSWVAMSVVIPRRRPRTRWRSAGVVVASSAANGSSSKTTSGSQASDRASATR